MAEITAELVKQLRERTGAGMMDCKKALQEAKGDLAEAEVVLRKRGIASAAKRATRATKQGLIGTYLHGPLLPKNPSWPTSSSAPCSSDAAWIPLPPWMTISKTMPTSR